MQSKQRWARALQYAGLGGIACLLLMISVLTPSSSGGVHGLLSSPVSSVSSDPVEAQRAVDDAEVDVSDAVADTQDALQDVHDATDFSTRSWYSSAGVPGARGDWAAGTGAAKSEGKDAAQDVRDTQSNSPWNRHGWEEAAEGDAVSDSHDIAGADLADAQEDVRDADDVDPDEAEDGAYSVDATGSMHSTGVLKSMLAEQPVARTISAQQSVSGGSVSSRVERHGSQRQALQEKWALKSPVVRASVKKRDISVHDTVVATARDLAKASAATTGLSHELARVRQQRLSRTAAISARRRQSVNFLTLSSSGSLRPRLPLPVAGRGAPGWPAAGLVQHAKGKGGLFKVGRKAAAGKRANKVAKKKLKRPPTAHDVKQLMAAAAAAKARVKVAEADALRVFKSAGCDAVTDRRRAGGGVDNDTTFDSGAQDARDASWNVEPFVTVVDGFSSGLHSHRRDLGQIDRMRVVGCENTVGVKRVEEAQKAATAARQAADRAQRAAEAAADAAMFAAIDAAASKLAPIRKGVKNSRHKGDLADFASDITSIGSWKAGKVVGTEDDSSMTEKHADGSQAARLASPDKEHRLETPAQASSLQGWAKTQMDLDPFNGNGAKSAYSDAYTQGWPTGGAGQLTAVDRAAGAIGVQEARAGKWKMLQAQEYFGAARVERRRDESKRSRHVASTTAANVGILRQHSHLRPVLQGLPNFRSKVAGLMGAGRNRHRLPSATNHRPRTSVPSSVVKVGQWVRRGTRRQTWRQKRQLRLSAAWGIQNPKPW